MADPLLTEGFEQLESDWIGNPTPAGCARLADLLRQAGRLDEASQLASEGIRRWPDNSLVGVVLGRCLRESGKMVEAAGAFESVLLLQPLNLVALKNLGEICFNRRKWRRSVECLEEYLFEHSGDQEAIDMLEQARVNMDSAGPLDDDEAEDIDRDLEDPDENMNGPAALFPETERMARVLQAQGIEPSGVREEEPEGSEDSDREEEYTIPVEPASLLDLFSPEEREDLGLGSFDGDLI